MRKAQQRIGLAVSLIAGALLAQAAMAQAPPPGVFAEVQTAVVPRPSPALEPATLRTRLVQVDTREITAARRGREALTLNLFDDAVMEVRIRRVRPTRNGYFISGQPRGMEWGEVQLVVNGPVMVGTVTTPQGKFTIRSAGSGRHVIRQVDPLKESFECDAEQESTIVPQPSRQPFALAGLPIAGASLPALAEEKHMPTEDGSEIRMLVVYTPAARDGEGGTAGMEALIDLAIQSMNEVFELGGINPRIVLAHTAMVDPIEHAGPGTLGYLRRQDDGYLDDVHALRNQHAADLVYLFIRRNSGGTGSGGIPSAADLSEEDGGFAYGSTTRDLEYIFIHETGHALGLHHERYRYGTRAGEGIYPYAYGYVNQRMFEPGAPESARWATVMAKSGQCAAAGFSCPPIIRFSNPDQTHLGDALGVSADSKVAGPAGPADARLAINNIAPWVGSFRSEACADFAVSPTTPVAPVDGGEIVLEVSTAPGCLWEASSQVDFLTITSDALNAGPQQLIVQVAENANGVDRSGNLTVAGQQITVRQLATSQGVCGRSSQVLEAITVAAGYASGEQCAEVMDHDLDRIETLNLSGKSIDSLKPRDFSGLSGLRRLDLDSNELSEFPEHLLAELSALEVLSLNSNDLSELPRDLFKGLASLRYLYLEDNELNRIHPRQFAGLSELAGLDLSHNQIVDLPAGVFAGLSGLENLQIKNNRLTRLPDALFSDLGRLQTLAMDGNQVAELPGNVFSGLSRLQGLYLADNRLSRLPDGIFDGLSDLWSLSLADNSFTQFPTGTIDGLNNLRRLILDGNRLTELPEGALAGLPRLTSLGLAGNSLANVPAGAFTGLTELENLALGSNDLDSLPAGVFSDQSQLTRLHLSHNRLRSLPHGVFAPLAKLETLYLHYNNLSALIEDVFSGLAELDTLYLNDNKLNTLPNGIFSGVPRLAEVNLTYNNVEPLPISLGLVKVGSSQFKAVAPQGAPFAVVIPLIISDGGTIDGGQETITIPAGALESAPLGVKRAAGREEAVRVDFGDFPHLPSRHVGYSLEQDGSLPLHVLPSIDPDDASLNLLAVGGATLDPAFSPDETRYSAIVADKVSSVSVTSTTEVADASVSYFDDGDVELEDADTTTEGFQFDLMEVANTIRIRVTSGNDQSTRTYTLVVTRDKSTNVCGRTPQVRDAIVAAIPGVEACESVTEAQLSEIIRLDLDRKSIAFLNPDDFAGLNKLATLILRNNQLETIPANLFAAMNELGQLSLSGNPLSGVSAETFAGLTSLHTLDLGDIGLTTLPGGVFSALPNLGKLVLRSNRLSSLTADVIDGLPKLWSLDLARNRFSKLPPGLFSGLSTLRELHLNGNRLRNLAVEEFANLRTLRWLDLRENLLSELPPGVFSELDGLTRLDLRGNLFAIVPASVFSGLTQLEDLELEHNLVDPLPLPVSLESAGENQFEAIVPSAAPFTLELTVVISDFEGIDSDSVAVTVPAGAVESARLTLTRLPEAGETVTVDITDLPALPDEHKGYALTRDESLPLLIVSGQAAQSSGQVTGVEATAGSEELDVSWNAVDDASGYKVQWKSGAEDYGDDRQALISGGDRLSYTITGLIAGTEYTVRVIATGEDADDGPPSGEVTSTPLEMATAQVQDVTVTGGIGQLEVSWTALADSDGYKVQWKSGDEDYADTRQSTVSGGETTTYTITGLTAGTEYTVRVIATSTDTEDGAPSSEVTGTPKAAAPSRVTGVAISAGENELAVSWTAVSDADGYRVQWKSGNEDYADARQGSVSDGDTTTYTITGLTTGTEYTVHVIATKDNAEDGPPSREVTATPSSSNPDVNGDGALDGNDALVMYNAYASEALLGDGETGGTAASRQTLLAGYSGKTNPTDDELKEMIRKALAWRDAGAGAGGDINEDGVIDESDALVMYYAYTTSNLVGDGNTGGTERFRQLLLEAFANKANPTDEDLKAMLRRANRLRENFG